MPIGYVERFYCPRCGYTTEAEWEIEAIKGRARGYCPACGDGKSKEWTLEWIMKVGPYENPELRGK